MSSFGTHLVLLNNLRKQRVRHGGGGRGGEHIYILRKNGSILKNRNPLQLQIIRGHRWLKHAWDINAAIGEEAVAVATGSADSSRTSAVCREHFRHRKKMEVLAPSTPAREIKEERSFFFSCPTTYLFSSNVPFRYTFGTNEQSQQEAEGVPWRAGEESLYIFFRKRNPVQLQIIRGHRWHKYAWDTNAAVGGRSGCHGDGSANSSGASAVWPPALPSEREDESLWYHQLERER
ncbi:hypothetical protein CEXT_171741 [Caerostris extrusa]|uniref:Uncharacterized protein n=1 Tax=Caerostris extrusa TaxID=172846 RepID=A0AAV4V4W9_CAEEX|nr:hypothetical protein CEXT_171741 [Caerostris extrusa]